RGTPRMENQLNLSLRHLFSKIKNNQQKIFQPKTSQLPYLILAIKSLKEREADLQSTDPKTWVQLIWLIQDIRLSNHYLPETNPTTVWTETTILLRHLTSILQVKLHAQVKKTTQSEAQASVLTSIFISHARQFLIFRLSQIYCITELQGVTPQKHET
ncbi:Uncharacterized protein APZ42_008869, partial [Daphnia magna]